MKTDKTEDVVCSIMSLLSNLATVWLMNSLPLSE